MDWNTQCLDAKGRIGQKDFWIGFLILFVGGIILSFIPVIGQIASIILIYPWVCLFSKRLHDFGKTGWLAAVPFVIGFIAGIIAVAMGGAAMLTGGMGSEADALAAVGSAGLVLGLSFIIYIAFVLWVGLSKGDPGTNQYGSPRTPPLTGA